MTVIAFCSYCPISACSTVFFFSLSLGIRRIICCMLIDDSVWCLAFDGEQLSSHCITLLLQLNAWQLKTCNSSKTWNSSHSTFSNVMWICLKKNAKHHILYTSANICTQLALFMTAEGEMPCFTHIKQRQLCSAATLLTPGHGLRQAHNLQSKCLDSSNRRMPYICLDWYALNVLWGESVDVVPDMQQGKKPGKTSIFLSPGSGA